MAHLTLRLRQNGRVVFQSDFSAQEFIPLTREITRYLEQFPGNAPQLSDYRVHIQPAYSPVAMTEAQEAVGLPLFATLHDELTAFYNPGSSSLCRACPEQLRCPGSGLSQAGRLNGWIHLAADANADGRAVTGFNIRLVGAAQEPLFDQTLPVDRLFRGLAAEVKRRAFRQNRLAAGDYDFEIAVSSFGTPRVDPLLLHPVAAPAVEINVLDIQDDPALLGEELPETMVRWGGQEDTPRDEPPVELGDDLDLQIQIQSTVEDEALPSLDAKRLGAPNVEGSIAPGGLPIYLARDALNQLMDKNLLIYRIGFLAGKPFTDAASSRLSLYIRRPIMIATTDAAVYPELVLNFDALHKANIELVKSDPDLRIVGWYRLYTTSAVVLMSKANPNTIHVLPPDKVELSQDEAFMHRNFFSAAWQVGMVVNPIDRTCNFYRWYDNRIQNIEGFYTVT